MMKEKEDRIRNKRCSKKIWRRKESKKWMDMNRKIEKKRKSDEEGARRKTEKRRGREGKRWRGRNGEKRVSRRALTHFLSPL